MEGGLGDGRRYGWLGGFGFRLRPLWLGVNW